MLSLFFFKRKTAYEMRVSDWSSDVCSSDLGRAAVLERDRFEDPVDDPDRAEVEAGQDLSQCFGVVLAILEQALDLLSDVARGLPVFGEVSDRIPGFVRHAQDAARTFRAAGHGADRQSTRLNSSH